MKKIILPVVLIMLVSLSFLVNADAKIEVELFTMEKGWNLLYGFGHPRQFWSNSELREETSIRVVYTLNPLTQEYAQLYPTLERDKLVGLDDDEILNTALWVYSSESFETKYGLESDIVPFQERPLYQGWNFVGITNDMIGKTIAEMEGNCNVLKSYFYNAEQDETDRGTNWKNIPKNIALPEETLYKGLVIKVESNCKLDEDSLSPPAIPN
jgi:hypothetical protein